MSPFPSSGILLWCRQLLGEAVLGFGCGAGELCAFFHFRVCVRACARVAYVRTSAASVVSPGNKPEECVCVFSFFSSLHFCGCFVAASFCPLYEVVHYLYSLMNFSAGCTHSAPAFCPRVRCGAERSPHAQPPLLLPPPFPAVTLVVPSISLFLSFTIFHFYRHVFGSCCRKPSETPLNILRARGFSRLLPYRYTWTLFFFPARTAMLRQSFKRYT